MHSSGKVVWETLSQEWFPFSFMSSWESAVKRNLYCCLRAASYFYLWGQIANHSVGFNISLFPLCIPPPSLLSGQYEPRGPGRPLYQRRISSSYPEESSPANAHNALSQQAHPCTSDPQDHPHPHIQQHHQQPHGPYGYPSHDLWPSNGGGPGPFQNIPCNGAGGLAQQRDLLGRYSQICPKL